MTKSIAQIVQAHEQAALARLPLEPVRTAIAAHDTKHALALLDAEVASSPTDLIARLWWVRCQLEASRVPLSVLTAPLEEMFPRVKGEADAHELGAVCFLAVAAKLRERAQLRLAISMLERSLQLIDNSKSFPEDEQRSILAFVIGVVEEEISACSNRAEVRSRKQAEEKSEYLKQLQRKLTDLQARKPKTVVREPEKPAPSKGKDHPFTSKSILGLAEHGASAAQSSPLPQSVPLPEKSNGVRASSFMLLALSVLLLVGAGFFFRDRLFGMSRAALVSRLAMRLEPGLGPEARSPTTDVSSDSRTLVMSAQTGALAEVKQELERLEIREVALEKQPTREPVATKPPQEVKASPPPPADEVEYDPQPRPELPPPTTGARPVTSAGDSTHREPVGPLIRGRDGRVYGPPAALPEGGPNGGGRLAGARGLDGEPVRPLEVEEFSPPRLFRVIAATQVLDAPSLLARPVDRLDSDAKIQVIARLGHWLELVSVGGKKGYIYAQDAEQAGE